MPKRPLPPKTDLPIDPAADRALRRALLAWYRKHYRKLPWRPEPGPGNAARVNPYHALVSEAMLQQTQVATVIPYFERFVGVLPTVQHLADADEQRVLHLWQGLGYYRRARNLHAAARMIVDDFAGQVPADVATLLSLPGVGRYTAGAIASIAHGTPAPIVDGNVARVFARVFHLEAPIDSPAVQKRLWALAEQLVPDRSPGDFNQALMELGALVCTPKNPGCLTCPLRNQCAANERGDAEQLPVKLPRKKPRAVTHIVVAVRRSGKYLFEQRPASGLWSNMWQLPTWEAAPPEAIRTAANSRRVTHGGTANAADQNNATGRAPASGAANPNDAAAVSAWFADRFGVTPGKLTVTHDFTHQTTHRTIRFVLLTAEAVSGRTRPGAGRWLRLDQLDGLPLPNPQRAAVQHLAG